MLQEVTATKNAVGDTKDLMAFLDNRESVAETLRGSGMEPTEKMNVNTRKSEPTGCLHDANYGARTRPRTAKGITDEVQTVGGKMFVTLNFDENRAPFEVFLRIGKCGEIEYAHLEGLARMISYCLRIGGNPRGIVDQLAGITSEPVWDRGTLIRSAEDGVAAVIRQFLDGKYDELLDMMLAPHSESAGQMAAAPAPAPVVETDSRAIPGRSRRTTGASCVKCGGQVVSQEGCLHCLECGYGKCD